METVEASDYHDLVGVSEPRISPDGDRVAFVRSAPEDDESMEATVYAVPLGGDEPRQFTIAEGVDSEPRWSPSGDRIAFVSTRGADDDRPQLWVLPTEGGEGRQVTDVVGGVSSIEWSPDGDRIVIAQGVTAADRDEDRDLDCPEEYEPEPPDPRVIDRTVYRAHERYHDGRRSHLYVVDPVEGSIDRLTEGDRDHVSPTFGDASTLYYARKPDVDDPDDTIRHEVVTRDLDSGEETVLFETSSWLPSLAATTDGRIAYPYTPEERATLQQPELKVYDRETDEVTTPSEPLDRSLAGLTPQWGPDEASLYFVVLDEGSTAIYRAPGDASAEPEFVLGEAATIDGFEVGTDAIAYVQSDWDHPGDVFAATRGGAETRRLTRINADYLDGRAIAQPEELWVESGDAGVAEAGGDDAEVQAWVLTPPDFDPDEQYPLVVEIHGGPHAMWTTAGTMWHEFQTLAARGYVVAWSNPRGSVGYGESFMSVIEADWGSVTLEDVLAVADEVADREYVDADEQYVTGGSFGGYMTAWAVGNTDRFRAAVAQRGVYDLPAFWGTSDAYKLAEWEFEGSPWEAPETYREGSPTTYADEIETPTLLLHSDDDYRTPACTAEMFYRILRKQGVDTRMVRYPSEGHELSRSGEPGHVVDRIERIARWFDGYSEYRDAPPALDRERNAGLTGGEEGESEEEEEESAE